MPGPAPSAHARRRNRRPEAVMLPAAGRQGPAPSFPIPAPERDDGQRARHPAGLTPLWRELWAKPQAVQWERHGLERVVARYALLVLASERPKASGKTHEEVRHLEDRLGLNEKALKSLGWEVEDVPAVSDEDAEAANVAQLDDYRERLG